MAEQTQNFKNHVRLMPLHHYFVVPVLLINVIVACVSLTRVPSLASTWGVVFALGLLMLSFAARVQANTVQDRVIRLEMQLRLRDLLPADLKGRIRALTPRQLVALRFAGDGEMAELVRDVLDGKLGSGKAIKERIRDWQPDDLRA
jgi:hypothetical protein